MSTNRERGAAGAGGEPAALTAERLSDWYARNIEAEFPRFDPETGRFMEGPGPFEEGKGWAVTNQDIMLGMAYMYKTDYAGSRFYRSPELLERIGRTGDALRAFQDAEGKVEFVKTDGSKWGAIYMPWSMYHWLETYRLLETDLDVPRLARWREGLRLAYEGIDREMRESLDRREADPSHDVVHNIPTWNAMALHRAGSVFRRPEWQRTGETMIRLTLAVQHEDGFWPEHHGPTTLYNLVYIHALGLYARHGGTIDVLPALERALRFHERFTYPDGSRVETVDGRTKYDAHSSPMGLVGFTLIPRGESYAQRVIEQAIGRGLAWKGAHMADLLQYWNVRPEGNQERSLFEELRIETEWARTLVCKQDGWYVALSAFAAKKVESRWGQDRQSFIGVWQERSGLIVGGGNSKEQPEWSTFELRTAEGGHLYVPDAGAVDLAGREAKLAYGSRTLSVRLSELASDHIRLEFEAEMAEGDTGAVHIPLQLRVDGRLRTGDGRELPVTREAIRLQAEQGDHRIGHASWQLEFEGAYDLSWPSYPFNPYAADGAAPLKEAVAVLTLPLAAGVRRSLLIRTIR